jgi:hypothetical protein
MRALIICALAAGCAGRGTGSVSGSLFISECTLETSLGSAGAPAAFDLQPVYYVADIINDWPLRNIRDPMNRVMIRVQSSGNLIEESDSLYVRVSDVEQVADRVGQPIEVGPATNVRANLNLRRTCPRTSVQLELDGTITFSRFGVQAAGTDAPPDFYLQYGDFITANFDFTVVDRRALTLGGLGNTTTTPEVGGTLTGSFDFQIDQGRGAQAYP